MTGRRGRGGQVRPFSQDHRQASGSHSQSITSPCSLLSVRSPEPSALPPTGPGAEPAAENPACRASPHLQGPPPFQLPTLPPPPRCPQALGHLALTHLSPAPSGRRPCHPRGPLGGHLLWKFHLQFHSTSPGPGRTEVIQALILSAFIPGILTEHSLCPSHSRHQGDHSEQTQTSPCPHGTESCRERWSLTGYT